MSETHKCCECKNKKSIPGDSHIYCLTPDHTNKTGWFNASNIFDPWAVRKCGNFIEKETQAVKFTPEEQHNIDKLKDMFA